MRQSDDEGRKSWRHPFHFEKHFPDPEFRLIIKMLTPSNIRLVVAQCTDVMRQQNNTNVFKLADNPYDMVTWV